MSSPGDPPPPEQLPPLAAPYRPMPPLPPVPSFEPAPRAVLPVGPPPPGAYGMPVGYAPPRRDRRPGIITTIGVCSILVALLGLAGAGLTAAGAVGVLVSAERVAAMLVRSAATAPAAPAPPAARRTTSGRRGCRAPSGRRFGDALLYLERWTTPPARARRRARQGGRRRVPGRRGRAHAAGGPRRGDRARRDVQPQQAARSASTSSSPRAAASSCTTRAAVFHPDDGSPIVRTSATGAERARAVGRAGGFDHPAGPRRRRARPGAAMLAGAGLSNSGQQLVPSHRAKTAVKSVAAAIRRRARSASRAAATAARGCHPRRGRRDCHHARTARARQPRGRSAWSSSVRGGGGAGDVPARRRDRGAPLDARGPFMHRSYARDQDR